MNPADEMKEKTESKTLLGHGRERMTEIFVGGAGGRRPEVPVAPEELAKLAREFMSDEAWAYVAGGAGSESTASANRQAFERHRILPTMLNGLDSVDLSVDIFGRTLPAPFFLSPVGVLELAHPHADLAVARAAADVGLPMIFSNQASHPMEECARVMDNVQQGAPRWFQLYWSTSRELVQSFLSRAEACGCEALVLTLDTAMLGWRPRDLDRAYLPFLRGMGLAQYLHDPVFRRQLDEPLETGADPPRPPIGLSAIRTLLAQKRRYPGTLAEKLSSAPMKAVRRFLATYSNPSLTWDDLAWLRQQTKLPLVLKGILHPDDARRAIDHGADAVMVSNHGGRQIDGSIAALDALPGVVEAVDGAVPIFADSGFRSGADVFKGLALGATAIGLGRPWVYGLAIAGEDGVRDVLKNLLAELELTFFLTGCGSVGEIGPEVLVS